MHSAANRRLVVLAALLTVAALVGACGGAGATSSAPAASAASTSGTPAVSGDDSADLLSIAIAQPYTLVELPKATADTVQAGIEKNLGAYGKAVHVAVRAVDKQGVNAAYLMVVAFPKGTLSDSVYQQVLTNLSMGAEADFTSKPINGASVSFGPMSGGSVALFRRGDLVFITLAPTATDLTPIEDALVKVNG